MKKTIIKFNSDRVVMPASWNTNKRAEALLILSELTAVDYVYGSVGYTRTFYDNSDAGIHISVEEIYPTREEAEAYLKEQEAKARAAAAESEAA